MTIEEIRSELQARGWTQKELANMLHVHPVTLGLILTGKNKLTAQLASHIDLLLASGQEHPVPQEEPVEQKVSLPDNVVERWVPGFREMSDAQRSAAVLTILHDAIHWLIREGEKQFSSGELENIRNFCCTHSFAPSSPVLCQQDDEGPLLSAADGDDECR